MYTKNLPELKVQKDNQYIYFIDYEHPLAVGNSGKVYLHRHVASVSLGRWLNSNEHVHHIDCNRQNNNPSNLQVLSNDEHNKIHHPSPLQDIECPNCNKIFKQSEVNQIYCSTSCSYSSKIRDKSITKELLEELIPKMSWVALGKLLGYSDNGIKKRARSLGCYIPDRAKRT